MTRIMNLTTNITEDSSYETAHHLEDTEFAVISGYICLVGMIGFVGNSWVITAFCRYKNLRTSTNIFIVHLAGCDLLLAFMDLAFSFPSSLNHHWLFGSVMCDTFGFAYYFLNAMSLNTLAVISLDRFWVIAKPSFGAKITVKRAVLCVVLTYIYTLLFTLPIIFGWVDFQEETYFTGCYLNFENRGMKTLIYSITMAVFLFCVPFGVMVYCYCSIFVSVRRRSQRNSRFNSTTRNRKHSRKFTLPHWRTARMIIVVISVFLLSWSPHVIVSLCVAFRINISILVQEITLLLAKSGIIYNPFIYAVLNHRFRNAFLGMLCRWRQNGGGGDCSRTPVISGGLGSSFRISRTNGSTLGKALSERLSDKELAIDCSNSQCKLKRFNFYKTKMTISSFEELRYANGNIDSKISEVHENRQAQVRKFSLKQVEGGNNDIRYTDERTDRRNFINATAKISIKRLTSAGTS